MNIEACEFVLLLGQIDYMRLIADVVKLNKHVGHHDVWPHWPGWRGTCSMLDGNQGNWTLYRPFLHFLQVKSLQRARN